MPPVIAFGLLLAGLTWMAGHPSAEPTLLRDHLLVTWYGNPRSPGMGILGEQTGEARATGLRQQAAAYAPLTSKRVLMAYHVVAVVAQCTPGADGLWRRRETLDVLRALLDEARAYGFRLILDIQPGRSTVAAEVDGLEARRLPPKILIVHQFRLDMLPDKASIRRSTM